MKQITKLTLTALVALALSACGGQAPTTGAPTGTAAGGTSGTPDMSMTSMPGMGETSTSESTPQMSETSVPTLASTSAAGSSTSVATGTAAPAGTAAVTGTDVLTNSDVLTRTSGTGQPGAGTIGGVLASDPRISTLSGLVKATGLESTFSQTGASFTLFAPADTAFATLPPETLRTVLADMTKVREILSYHVVQRKLTSADLASSTSLTTLQGEALTLSNSGGDVTINGKVKLVGAPIETGNGVIYIIDQLLLPSTVKLTQ